MELKIDKIILHHGHMPIEVRFSYGTPKAIGFTVVRVLAGGHEGLGECLGSPYKGMEALAKRIIGRDACLLDGLLSEASRTYEPSQEFGANVVREMLSMALHDLVAKAHGVPLHLLLGGARRKRIPLMPCIFPKDPEDGGRTARKFLGQGFKALKVKIFGDLTGDVEIIRSIRRVMPEGFLQADANCGYKSLEAARKALTAFAEVGLTVAEDPLEGTLDDYAALCREFTSPRIMLDEATRGWGGIHETCAKKAAHVINLHPNNQGPFSEILTRAVVAKAAEIPVMVGGTGYPGIGSFAYAHVASVIGLEFPFGDVCGVVDHGMPMSTAKGPLSVEQGQLMLLDAPGHGAELNTSTVEKYASETIVLVGGSLSTVAKARARKVLSRIHMWPWGSS